MFKAERKLTELIEKHLSILCFAAFSVLGFLIRIKGRHFLSSDMDVFLIPWFEDMQAAGGLKGLKEQIGDYNVLYQTVIALMTYIPLNPMTMYKALSCGFDYLTALTAALLAAGLLEKPRFGTLFNSVYAVFLFLPTVVLNSAYWGQCDSMYAFCLLLALWLLYREKDLASFILLGLAFALKLQTVFVLPFWLAVYFVKKRFSLAMFLVSLASFWLSGGDAYLFGRELLAPFRLYMEQTSTYQSMWLCSRSFWQVFGNDYPEFGSFAILFALSICGLGFYVILARKKEIDSPSGYFSAAAWFVWVCIFFLPAMHERYAYFLDLLLVLLAFLDRRYIKFAAASAFLSFMSYAPFLVHDNGLYREDAFIEFFIFIWFTHTVMTTPETKPKAAA